MPSMRSLLLLYAATLYAATLAGGAQEGLYTMDTSGQLWIVDAAVGNRSAVGAALTASGWAVPSDCSPSAVDTTVKLLFLLARPLSAPAAPWHLLGVQLSDGMVALAVPLPTAFPPSLAACEHVLTEDGSCHVFIAASVNTSGGDAHLRAQRYTAYGPEPHEWAPLVDAAIAPLGLGEPLARPDGAVTDFAMWFLLSEGLIGVDVASGSLRALPGIHGASIAGLHYDTVGAQRLMYALQASANGSSTVVSFYDSGAGAPALNCSAGVVAAVPAQRTAVALRSDLGALTVLDGVSGELVTVGLEGEELSRVPGCSGGCPILLAAEPMVFVSGRGGGAPS